MKKITLFLTICFCITTNIFSQVNEIKFNQQNFNSSLPPRTNTSPMSIKLLDNYNNGGPTTYGSILEIYGLAGHQTGQLYFGGWDNSKIRYREAFYAENTWNNWITLLDSKNDVESAGSLKITGNANSYFLNGNVGIGTTTPEAKLDVAGSQIIRGNLGLSGGKPNSNINFESQNGFHRIAFNKLNFWDWDTGGDMLTLENGNVGIGTTTPAAKLDVAGDIKASGVIASYSSSEVGGRIDLVNPLKTDPKTAVRWSIYNMTGNYGNSLQFWSYPADGSSFNQRLKISDDGNMALFGKFESKEIKVTTTPTADFVFANDYKLPTLETVEKHIKANKHLPEIASAAQMEKEGVNVGEFQIKLLQKIEELTLYTIEQNKKLLILQAEIETLKKAKK